MKKLINLSHMCNFLKNDIVIVHHHQRIFSHVFINND